MNREIKFRAWDNINKEMIFRFAINSQTQEISQIRYPYKRDMSKLRICDNDWKIMQSTNLKDKNGKEIYEGDIIEIIDNEYKKTYVKCVVGWQVDSYKCFKNIDMTDKWDNGDSYEDWSDDVDWGDTTIIGNIYENPKLLKSNNQTED